MRMPVPTLWRGMVGIASLWECRMHCLTRNQSRVYGKTSSLAHFSRYLLSLSLRYFVISISINSCGVIRDLP
jgi:hypothetical protein